MAGHRLTPGRQRQHLARRAVPKGGTAGNRVALEEQIASPGGDGQSGACAPKLRIPGVGESKRRQLLATFGSLQGVREASVEAIAALPSFGQKTAEKIIEALRASSPVSPSPVAGESDETSAGVGGAGDVVAQNAVVEGVVAAEAVAERAAPIEPDISLNIS